MENAKYCGTIKYKDTDYTVYLETGTDRVWVEKPSDDKFGSENYDNSTARNEKEAFEIAKEMLQNSGK